MLECLSVGAFRRSYIKLEKMEEEKRVLQTCSVREVNQVKMSSRNHLVKLVCEKPLLHCSIGGEVCDALWDTGAMVSMVSVNLLKEEFLDGDKLKLCAANNTNVNVDSVALFEVQMGCSRSASRF